jgi:hypothetical protein
VTSGTNGPAKVSAVTADHHHGQHPSAVRDHRRALGRNAQRLTLLICEAPPGNEWRERAESALTGVGSGRTEVRAKAAIHREQEMRFPHFRQDRYFARRLTALGS